MTTWQPVDTLAEIEGEWEFIYSAETPHERSRLIDVQLPDGYAVCQRVEPEGARVVERDTGKMHEYRSGEWQPVADLEYTPGDEYLILRDGIIGTGYIDMAFEYSPVNVVLPENLRLCKRVEPEAITPEALQREPGWEPLFYDGVPALYTRTIKFFDGVTTKVNWETATNRVEVFEECIEIDEYTVTVFPGVKTMADLRTLARFLSGGAE